MYDIGLYTQVFCRFIFSLLSVSSRESAAQIPVRRPVGRGAVLRETVLRPQGVLKGWILYCPNLVRCIHLICLLHYTAIVNG
jgi:hypothetical protein